MFAYISKNIIFISEEGTGCSTKRSIGLTLVKIKCHIGLNLYECSISEKPVDYTQCRARNDVTIF